MTGLKNKLWVFFRVYIRDHALLRVFVPNLHSVDGSIFRSGQPSARILARAKRRGVVSILSLRGNQGTLLYRREKAQCDALGLAMETISMRSTSLPKPHALLELIHLLREMPKPMLVHCKSGADRTGLAATLYLHVLKDEPLASARRALNWRYGHFAFTKAGIVHRLLDAYAADHAESGIGFEDWVATRYDPAALSQ